MTRALISLSGAMRAIATDEAGSASENVSAVHYLLKGADRIDELEGEVIEQRSPVMVALRLVERIGNGIAWGIAFATGISIGADILEWLQ